MKNKKITIISYVFLFIFPLLLSGCASTVSTYSQLPQAIPVNVSKLNFPEFGIARIKSSLVPGTILGSHHDGWAKVKYRNYYAAGNINSNILEGYLNGIREELENAGYKVDENQGGLFENTENWKARFLIGGRIIKSETNTFAPLAGNYSEYGVTVNWEVYDRQKKAVIYKNETSGYSRLSGITPVVCLAAFRNSFRSFLSSQNFTDFMTDYLKKPQIENPSSTNQ